MYHIYIYVHIRYILYICDMRYMIYDMGLMIQVHKVYYIHIWYRYMYVYMYTHIYKHIYTYIHTYIYIYYTYIHIYIYIYYTYTHIYIYIYYMYIYKQFCISSEVCSVILNLVLLTYE